MWITIFAIIAQVNPLIASAEPKRIVTRGEHYRNILSEIAIGMDQASVRRILGSPDIIVLPKDFSGSTPSDVSESWGFGVDQHGSFPVFGEVQFDLKGNSLRVSGGLGNPPSPEIIEELELQKGLRLVHSAPPIHGWRYDPKDVIRIVNGLQPLGKKRAIAVIHEYVRVSSEFSNAHQGLHLVIRALFDVPKDVAFLPNFNIGLPSPLRPEKYDLVPRFPLLVEEDVPLLLVSGYSSFGSSAELEMQLSYFERHGIIRATLMNPTARPFELIAKFDEMPEWHAKSSFGNKADLRVLLMSQILRLTENVHKTAPEDTRYKDYIIFPGDDLDIRWLKIVDKCRGTEIRWSLKLFDYQKQ